MTANALPRLLAMALLLAATWFVYRPGLVGGFIFDDFANLPALGETGPIDDSAAIARYLTSGNADPIGRPLALASFLIDAHDWPADPRPFKVTNVLLHLINGLLLFFVLDVLGRRVMPSASRSRVLLAAWIGCAVWLLHPFLVSTTLYIVQREAMLPATFVLIGILAWAGVDLSYRQERSRAIVGYSVLACICVLLATLSKANGLLLPVLILAVDCTLLAPRRPPGVHPSQTLLRGLRASLWGWTILILVWLLRTAIVNMSAGLSHRSWTEGQRLLTEPRILWDYLAQLWAPHPYTAGVFNDTVTVSTDLFHPLSTLPAILGLAVLLTATIMLRRRSPVVACAILFFFSGHLLESTSVPLELYFEHRNYLPSMLLFWPLGMWLTGLQVTPSTKARIFPSRPYRYALTAIVIVSVGVMTHANATVWGDTYNQAALWARLNPDSARAQVGAAQEDIRRGLSDKAVARLTPMLQQRPSEVQIAFNLIAGRCALNELSPADLTAARYAIATTVDPGALISTWFDRTTKVAKMHGCRGLELSDLAGLAQAGLNNPRLPAGRRQDLEHALGDIALADDRAQDALIHFNRALTFDVRDTAALKQAAELGSAGFPRLGLEHLAFFDGLPKHTGIDRSGMQRLHDWVLQKQDYWPRERRRLESTLRADLQGGYR